MDEVIALVASIMGLSIPLSIVIGFFHLRSKKLSLKQFTNEERQVLLELKTENAELKRRLDQLELSIGAPELDFMEFEKVEELDTAKRLELLAQQQKRRLK